MWKEPVIIFGNIDIAASGISNTAIDTLLGGTQFLASKFYESKYNFMRRFKEYTGYSIHNYILEKRLLLTEKLVGEGMKVTLACIEAGFSNYSTYLRAKKRAEALKEKSQSDI